MSGEELELKEKADAQQNFNKLVEWVNKTHPIPEKAKTSQKIIPTEEWGTEEKVKNSNYT